MPTVLTHYSQVAGEALWKDSRTIMTKCTTGFILLHLSAAVKSPQEMNKENPKALLTGRDRAENCWGKLFLLRWSNQTLKNLGLAKTGQRERYGGKRWEKETDILFDSCKTNSDNGSNSHSSHKRTSAPMKWLICLLADYWFIHFAYKATWLVYTLWKFDCLYKK